MSLFITIAGLTGFYFVMADFWDRMPAAQGAALHRWFRHWTLRGLAAPFLVWMLFNSAVFSWAPPLMPQIELAKLNHHWADALEYSATLGLFVIGSYWAALTTAWLLSGLARWTDDPALFRRMFLAWSAVLFPVCAAIVYWLGWRFAGLGVVLWLMPIAQQTGSLRAEEKLRPIYSRAIAALHFDRHEAAEALVLAELENCEDDFEGWMLLADLYANQFNDLEGAESVIRETCAQPATNASQFAVAFHKLADWQLKLKRDPAAARKALEEICRRYPKSHLDKMARLRIRQLPSTAEALAAEAAGTRIRLPRLHRALDEPPPAGTLSRAEAGSLARQESERLHKNPDDVAARERLARLLAEELDNPDLGLEQLELLLGMADPPPGKPAEWMAQMAAWQIRFKQDRLGARKTLERLLRLYPQSVHAFSAQRRLSLMEIEARLRVKKA